MSFLLATVALVWATYGYQNVALAYSTPQSLKGRRSSIDAIVDAEPAADDVESKTQQLVDVMDQLASAEKLQKRLKSAVEENREIIVQERSQAKRLAVALKREDLPESEAWAEVAKRVHGEQQMRLKASKKELKTSSAPIGSGRRRKWKWKSWQAMKQKTQHRKKNVLARDLGIPSQARETKIVKKAGTKTKSQKKAVTKTKSQKKAGAKSIHDDAPMDTSADGVADEDEADDLEKTRIYKRTAHTKRAAQDDHVDASVALDLLSGSDEDDLEALPVAPLLDLDMNDT